jgi:hypothetical protein
MKSLFVEKLTAEDGVYLSSVLKKYAHPRNAGLFSDRQFALVIEPRKTDEPIIVYLYFDGTDAEFEAGCDMVSVEQIGDRYKIYLMSDSGVSIELLAQSLTVGV